MNAIKAIGFILTLRCDEASKILSRGFDEELPRSERWALAMHRVTCGPCRQLRKQLQSIHIALRERATTACCLSEDARGRLARRIAEAARDNG